MTRIHIAILVSTLAGPIMANAQNLTDNNKVASVNTPPATQPVIAATPAAPTTDSVVKTPAGRSKATPKKIIIAANWQKEDDQTTGSISRDLLTKLKLVNTQLVAYLYDSVLEGATHKSAWHGEFRLEKTDSTGLKYGIKCIFPTPADGHTVSTPANLEIKANDLSSVIRTVNVYGHDYTAIIPTKGMRNGCPYFEPTYAADGAMVVAVRTGKLNLPRVNTWLVAASPEEMPYTAMSRKEFLEAMSASLKSNKEALARTIKAKNPVRPQAEQDAAKEKNLQALSATYTGVELQMRKRNYLEQYKSDDEDLKENIDAQTAPIDSTISFIEGMLHNLSSGTLAATAYVSAKATEFEGFADGEEGAVMITHPILSTTGSATGATATGVAATATDKPRYFVISWTADPTDTDAAAIKDMLTKKLDPAHFKAMLKN